MVAITDFASLGLVLDAVFGSKCSPLSAQLLTFQGHFDFGTLESCLQQPGNQTSFQGHVYLSFRVPHGFWFLSLTFSPQFSEGMMVSISDPDSWNAAALSWNCTPTSTESESNTRENIEIQTLWGFLHSEAESSPSTCPFEITISTDLQLPPLFHIL